MPLAENQFCGSLRRHRANTVLHRLAVHRGGGAIVMVAILLITDTFRGNTTVSRWRDPAWLAWLAVPLYWVHQFEEYSLPVIGIDYSIQEMICQKIGFPPYPDCPIPLAFYPVVNIALMWFGAPLAAYLFRRNVLIGLSYLPIGPVNQVRARPR